MENVIGPMEPASYPNLLKINMCTAFKMHIKMHTHPTINPTILEYFIQNSHTPNDKPNHS